MQDIMNVTVKDDFLKSCQIFGTTHFQIIKLSSEKLVINHIFVIAFDGILIIPTILLNGVAAIMIFKSSQLNSKPCYFIILLQSMFDLAVGMVGIPLYIYYVATTIGGISNCVVAVLARRLPIAPYGGSSIALTAMTVERYIAILHPYAYKTCVSKEAFEVHRCHCNGGIFRDHPLPKKYVVSSDLYNFESNRYLLHYCICLH